MNRQRLLDSATEHARKLGWTDVEVLDEGKSVMALLNAAGATEQMVEARLSKLRKELSDLGGPGLYPETVEYDTEEEAEAYRAVSDGEEPLPAVTPQDEGPIEEFERIMSPCAKLAAEEAEAKDHEDEPDVKDTPVPELSPLQYVEPESPRVGETRPNQPTYPEPSETVALPSEIVERAQKELEKETIMITNPREMNVSELKEECRKLDLTNYTGVRKAGLVALVINARKGAVGLAEDVSPNTDYEVSPKEAATTPNPQVSQDRGGIPHPEQLFKDMVIEAPEGYSIVARNGDAERTMCGTTIEEEVKKAWERNGWKFFFVRKETVHSKAVEAVKAGQAVTVNRNTGKIHCHKVGGRVVADKGYKISLTRGPVVQRVKSVGNTQLWRDNGWALRVVRA